jgi:hypothetical protein
MSIRYDENTKARAVRLVREHRDDYDSEWAVTRNTVCIKPVEDDGHSGASLVRAALERLRDRLTPQRPGN